MSNHESHLTCPACLRPQLSVPEYRSVIEQVILKFVRIHAFQCQDCTQRFYPPRKDLR